MDNENSEQEKSEKKKQKKIRIMNIRGKQFFIEVADSFWKMVRGLMFRKPLPPMHGLLLAFRKEGYHGIWMPFMRFSLDLIFLDENLQIVDAKHNVPPVSILKPSTWKIYKPRKPCRYVLEVTSQG